MKTLGKLLVLILVIVGIAIAGATFYLDSIAKKTIEYCGSQALGVNTSVNKLHISILDGSSSITGLSIANPKGYSANNFIALKQAKVAIDVGTITSNIIHISEISLSGLHLNLEQSDQASNVKSIMDKLPKGSTTKGQPGATTAQQKKSDQKTSNKKFVVDKLVLSDIGVSAKIQALGAKLSDVSLNVPQIKLTNIGQQQGGMTMPELIRFIVEQVVNGVANNSNSIPALATLFKGDFASTEDLKAGAIEAASAEANKAAQKMLRNINLPQEDNAEIQQAADALLKRLFNKE
ncbi:MAG: hypothetical protein B6I36_08235 [Desulfobacteraceae bacterium 4572_35.1]|nr:MAG: hypothetical protein B6I36_08235 [Desulfobacteraceae bacterium 4572_35.1]